MNSPSASLYQRHCSGSNTRWPDIGHLEPSRSPPALSSEGRAPDRWWERHRLSRSSSAGSGQGTLEGVAGASAKEYEGLVHSLLSRIESLERRVEVSGDWIDGLHLIMI